VPATFDHANVAPKTCNTCHTQDKPAQHFITQAQCDKCHTTTRWLPLMFMHRSAAYPGDHAGNLECTECHKSNSRVVTWSSPAYQPDCAGCHANDFKPGPHKKHEDPDRTYNVSQLRDCAGACHVYEDSSLTKVKKFRPGPEHRVNQREF
jgi:hypothetical protein